MTIQLSTAVRSARIQALETSIGTGAIIKIWSGAQPANCAAADSGTELASITLASNWASVSGAVLTFDNAPLQDAAANGTGTAGHYRVYASDGTTCGMHGSVTITGGGGDMTVDNTSFATGQEFNITGWTITDGNA